MEEPIWNGAAMLIGVKRLAQDDGLDEVVETGAGLIHARHDGVDVRAVEGDHLAAERVGQQAFGEVAGELFMTRADAGAKFGRRFERVAIGKFAGGIDGQVTAVFAAPAADGIVVFQREPQRIDLAMARGAGGDLAVFGELIADGGGVAGRAG